MPATIRLDLTRPPSRRWDDLAPHAPVARALGDSYLRELGLSGPAEIDAWAPLIDAYRASFVRPDLGEEIDAIARMCDRSPRAVLVANLYYDLVRTMLGCTAFAVDGADGPIHARNLDWWTEDAPNLGLSPAGRPFRLLAGGTLVVEATGAPAGPFTMVGWPSFVGTFSAVAPGRFAVTLNAVLSDERAPPAAPIALLLREVLERCPTFDEAVRVLAETPIACDCLLLVTGSARGQLVVIERTPTRAALRGPQDGVLAVTNDFRALPTSAAPSGDELGRTSCGRFDRALARAAAERPRDAAGCLAILADPEVRMPITVQQMAMHARSGALEVRIP